MKVIRNNQAGFSLVEMMVVVAIIAVLAALGDGYSKEMMAKARQAEAKTNTASAMSLIFSKDDLTPQVVLGSPDSNQRLGDTLSNDDDSGVDSCNVANELGFKITNCQKVRYSYYVTWSGASWSVQAIEIRKPEGSGYVGKVAVACDKQTLSLIHI